MNHACVCGHRPADHCDGIGRCAGTDEGLFGPAPCHCPAYEWQGDD